MKTKASEEMADDLLPEYDFKQLLKNGVRGKYVERCKQGTNLILLEPDVAEAFPTGTSVNEALRLVMKLRALRTRRKRVTSKV